MNIAPRGKNDKSQVLNVTFWLLSHIKICHIINLQTLSRKYLQRLSLLPPPNLQSSGKNWKIYLLTFTTWKPWNGMATCPVLAYCPFLKTNSKTVACLLKNMFCRYIHHERSSTNCLSAFSIYCIFANFLFKNLPSLFYRKGVYYFPPFPNIHALIQKTCRVLIKLSWFIRLEIT